ncbi:MAG TPA: hypothetical protein VFN90_05810 [Gemmatimonadales bacterium]|nr:hypothetical protein [Gemmatimonadales bacterium]
MPRVLTAARARVAAEHEAEYLAILEVLARRRRARGPHLWVFRARDEAQAFLEFREGADDAALEPADAEEAALEARLAVLATYDASTRHARWDEIPAAG